MNSSDNNNCNLDGPEEKESCILCLIQPVSSNQPITSWSRLSTLSASSTKDLEEVPSNKHGILKILVYAVRREGICLFSGLTGCLRDKVTLDKFTEKS